jgi:hypothetical protein
MKTKCCYKIGWTREVCIDVENLQTILEVYRFEEIFTILIECLKMQNG